MSSFICSKCGCVDNTATSSYWMLIHFPNELVWNEDLIKYKGKPLCSECAKIIYSKDGKDGKVVPGKWHNKFKKEKATEEELKNMLPNGRIKNY